MASKKKRPSFDIPDTVRQAGQSGWVYRSDAAKAREAKPTGRRPAPGTPAAPEPEPRVPAAARSGGEEAGACAEIQPTTVAAGEAPAQTVVQHTAEPPASGGADTNETAAVAGLRPTVDAAEAVPTALGTGLLGFGLHVAAVPFIVPLYVSAAISRRLGLAEKQ